MWIYHRHKASLCSRICTINKMPIIMMIMMMIGIFSTKYPKVCPCCLNFRLVYIEKLKKFTVVEFLPSRQRNSKIHGSAADLCLILRMKKKGFS